MNASHLLPVYPRLPIELVGACGTKLRLADGRELVDLYGGHAVCALGHGHPEITEVLRRGHAELDFFSNSLLMEVQERAARAVLADTEHLGYAHFVNSGAEANESALHVARQITGRRKVLSFDCSFHGRTPGVLAATGLAAYRSKLTLPQDPGLNGFIGFGVLEDLALIDSSVAAVLCESVPSLAGVWVAPEGYYAALEARCREVGALLIFDEIQGGVGRLGRWFAHQVFDVRPDMVTLAKSLGGGYPVAALLTTRELGDSLKFSDLGTTFGGGPLACRMMLAVAGIIQRDGLMARTLEIERRVRAGIGSSAQVRGAGCLLGLEHAKPAKQVQLELLERGFMVGTSNHPQTIRLLPMYTLSDEEVDAFCAAYQEVVGG